MHIDLSEHHRRFIDISLHVVTFVVPVELETVNIQLVESRHPMKTLAKEYSFLIVP